MPQTKEERKAYLREYRDNNKEKIAEKNKKYRANNKEKEKAYKKQYYAENPDKYRIRNWKDQGIIDGDFPLLEKVFDKETHCWICWKPYIGTRRKCLDHDWDIKDDSNPRYICCHTCNIYVVG